MDEVIIAQSDQSIFICYGKEDKKKLFLNLFTN
jgi:hypothetical protein